MNHQPICRIWSLLRNAGTVTLLRRPNCISIRQTESIFFRDLNTTTAVITPSATLNLKEKERTLLEPSVSSSQGEQSLEEEVKKVTPVDGTFVNGSSSAQIPAALLEMKIQHCNSPEELLNMFGPNALLKHACMIVHRLGQLAETDKSITMKSLNEDDKFIQVCNLVHRADYSHNPHLLFAALQGLEKLGVLESSDIYQTLNVELKWGIRRCQIRYLIRAIALFVPSGDKPAPAPDKKAVKGKEEEMDIVELAIHTLQRRWVEVVSGSDFNAVFKIMPFLNEETREKLEDRAVEMVSTFTPTEMRQIFITLAIQKRRPTPLLRTMAFHFAKSVDSSNTKDLIELTYALNELTFADPVLMEKILSNICSDLSTVDNSALISSLVTSLGQMRYKHKAIMRILDEWISQNFKKLRPFDCASWLLTCAALNHQTENTKAFCEQLKSVLTPKIASSHSEWVNIVHAMLVLNSHSDALFASVLSPEVITTIENLGAKSYKSKIKLLNINATAKKRQTETGYKGPLLNDKVESLWASSVLSTSDKKLSAIALDTMGSFLPPDKYLTLNQKLPCGVFVDAVCLINKNMEPISLAERNKNKIPCQPIAFVVEGYSSMTLGNKEPTGHTLLNRKLLEKEGYKVIAIPYTEFNASDKLLTRAKYLEHKMKGLGHYDSLTV